jgi:ubiquinone/menaquinone biosynthesis C-methylase UbiE
MATILRDLSYRYQWLYDTISNLAALSVGGEKRFRHLFLRDLSIDKDARVLDLCCGSGQSTGILVERAGAVVGLDASPLSLQRAKQNVPDAEYVEAFAEDMPLEDDSFDLVLTNTALHEMQPEQLKQILAQVHRVLKPDGVFTIVDFHRPTNWLYWLPLVMFLWLFETETAWKLIETNLVKLLREAGFVVDYKRLYAGGSLQIIYAHKPAPEVEAARGDEVAAAPVAIAVAEDATAPKPEIEPVPEATEEPEVADNDNNEAVIIEYTEQIEDMPEPEAKKSK